jgi:sialate O-acetylesterase
LIRFTSVVLSLAFLVPVARADVKLPAIFGDHMVLQRDQKVPVWGWADADEEVTVTILGEKVTAKPGPDGRWQVLIGGLKASDQPIEMTVTGKNIITIKDILVGDVWVASGQSNMEWALNNTNHAKEELPNTKQPMIRLFMVPKKVALEPQKDIAPHQTLGKWELCDPSTVGKFSAVGYWFAKDIAVTQKVPVGMIGTYWGGTPAQAWTSIEALKAMPECKEYVSTFETALDPAKVQERLERDTAKYEQDKAKWDEEVGNAFNEKLTAWQSQADAGKPAPPRPTPSRPAPRKPGKLSESNHLPSGLYNGMIAPIVPFGIKGAIWYQGESNAGRPVEYQTLFPGMITDWRNRWGQGQFPFLWVQLANFMKRTDEPTQSAGGWAGLREAQSMALRLPATGQAVIIDIGEEKDIHPRDKKNVGQRLALSARAIAYGENIVHSGPVYDSMKIEGDKIRLSFKHTGGGLTIGAAPTTRPGQEPEQPAAKLIGFVIAGTDQKFVWADATIEGDSVIVSSPDVKDPAAVRYAWGNNPAANLYNKDGLPASPFRTDNWKDASK